MTAQFRAKSQRTLTPVAISTNAFDILDLSQATNSAPRSHRTTKNSAVASKKSCSSVKPTPPSLKKHRQAKKKGMRSAVKENDGHRFSSPVYAPKQTRNLASRKASVRSPSLNSTAGGPSKKHKQRKRNARLARSKSATKEKPWTIVPVTSKCQNPPSKPKISPKTFKLSTSTHSSPNKKKLSHPKSFYPKGSIGITPPRLMPRGSLSRVARRNVPRPSHNLGGVVGEY